MSYYPVAPGMRFAYDTDGTRVFRTTAAHGWAEIPKSLLPFLIRADSGVYWRPDITQTNMLTLFFPEPRDIQAVFLACTFNRLGGTPYSYTVGGDKNRFSSVKDYPIRCETSVDTSDGINGTWNQTSFIHGNPRALVVSDASNVPYPSDYQQGYYTSVSARLHLVPGEAQLSRSDWSSFAGRATLTYRTGAADIYSDAGAGPAPLAGSSLGVRALRIWLETYNSATGEYEFQDSMFVQMLHVYGRITPTVPTGQLVAWHAVEDRSLTMADTDQGDVSQDSSGTVQFRIKNLSPDKTALSPSAFVDPPMVRTSPPLNQYLTLSSDGIKYGQSCLVDDLAPGGLSPIITVKRVTPWDAAMGVSSFRVGMSVRGWRA